MGKVMNRHREESEILPLMREDEDDAAISTFDTARLQRHSSPLARGLGSQ